MQGSSSRRRLVGADRDYRLIYSLVKIYPIAAAELPPVRPIPGNLKEADSESSRI
jgi:hypothetical protein